MRIVCRTEKTDCRITGDDVGASAYFAEYMFFQAPVGNTERIVDLQKLDITLRQ